MRKRRYQSEEYTQPCNEIKEFVEQYRDYCKLTESGLVLHYPEDREALPQIPVIKKQEIDIKNFQYIGYHNTKINDNRNAKVKSTGFFTSDSKFAQVCYRFWVYTNHLKQYKQVMSPDLSFNHNMHLINQWQSIFLSYLAGAYWQTQGITVIPTAMWGNRQSLQFAFTGIEYGSAVAVTTIGTGSAQYIFMDGFRELCKMINPEIVICYCNPYPEMRKYADIYVVKHEGSAAREQARYRPIPGQLSLIG